MNKHALRQILCGLAHLFSHDDEISMKEKDYLYKCNALWLKDNFEHGLGLTKFKAYVARDIDGRLFAYEKKPFFIEESGIWLGLKCIQMPQEVMPGQTFGIPPSYVEIEVRIRQD